MTLTSAPDADVEDVASGAFHGVLAAHRREGYDTGYWRGVNDTLASLILAAEESLAARSGDTAGLRQLIQQIYCRLERELDSRHDRHDYVEDGLGI